MKTYGKWTSNGLLVSKNVYKTREGKFMVRCSGKKETRKLFDKLIDAQLYMTEYLANNKNRLSGTRKTVEKYISVHHNLNGSTTYCFHRIGRDTKSFKTLEEAQSYKAKQIGTAQAKAKAAGASALKKPKSKTFTAKNDYSDYVTIGAVVLAILACVMVWFLR